MKTFYFLALAVMAIAEPSPEEIAAINNAEEPQSAKGHKIDKREAMPGYGPKIDVDMEINAGQRARVNIDIDVNIETEKKPKEGNDDHTAPNESPTTSDEYSTLSDISMVAWGEDFFSKCSHNGH
ncbi:uncharacterized protein LOC122260806 [Penaeus japonicus]|uniref:uncharacterized protein LOC122260806 n=1 Tax=Penaeus japonicus TaxID=27405 RepID=UPI001C70C53F|nr:uncharacterized protein LOC122260806 [Penaeus japonicus]